MIFFSEDLENIPRGPHDDFWYEPTGMRTASGRRVSPSGSLALPAVYSCVRVITDALMQVPLILYRRAGQDVKERATDRPEYALLHDQANERFTAAEWREVGQHHLLLRGNMYAEKRFNGSGRLEALEEPHHPDYATTRLVRAPGGRLEAQYEFRQRPDRPQDPATRTLVDSEVLHVRGMTLDGVQGVSPIEIEREAVGVGLSAQEFIGTYFGNYAKPTSGWVEAPQPFKTKAQREQFRESFQEAQKGLNRHKIAVLEYGMKYHPLEIKLVDQQFLELRKYQNHEIARIFRVPPHMIMEMDKSTFNNIEHQSIDFVKYTMLPWFKRWEQRLQMQVLDGDPTLFFEFLVDGLQRGDTKNRSVYYGRGIQDGWMTRNEVRVRENLNRLDGLDEPLQPMNMTPIDEDAQDDEPQSNGRAEELERSAAIALARKQAQELGRIQKRADSFADFAKGAQQLLSDASTYQRMMVLPEEEALEVGSLAMRDLVSSETELAGWEARQVERLIEASRSL